MFQTEIYRFRVFVRRYVVFVAFPSCVCRRGSVCGIFLLFFSSRGTRGHAVVVVSDPFSDLPFFGSEESV